MKKPNIILIMSDNHAADLLGCYGNDEIDTPHLDRLAAEGAQFNEAYCVNAMCSPCRASVLTGLIPSQHGIHTWIDDRRMETWPENWNALAEFETMPELLQQAGYDTALIGKYHLGSPYTPQNGFDHWVTFPHGHTRNFWGNTIIDNGREYRYDGHTVDCFTEKAVDYISDREGHERPFFMFLTYNAPYGHWPAIAGEPRNRFGPRYADTPMNTIPREGIHPDVVKRVWLAMEDSGQGLDYSAALRLPNDLPSLRNMYSQMSLVDDGVGRVMQALDTADLTADTLVIYTSDHGFSLGHQGIWGHGQATWPAATYRPSFSIPLLIKQPQRIAAEQTVDHLVSQVDIFATVLDYAGASTTAAHLSRSLVPLLEKEDNEWEDVIFMEQEETRSIRTPKWHYMHRFQGSELYPLFDALYDLEHDPDERVNLINEAAMQAVATQLRQQIVTYFETHAAPKYDLWQGGTAKSNTSRPWLWPDAWGEMWGPIL